jgi:uncharacterized membrane protein
MLNIVNGIVGAVKTLAAPVIDHFEHKRKLKEIEKEAQVEIKKARAKNAIHLAQKGQDHSHEWERKSLENSGWKDEYWTIILSVPMILCFIPGMDQYITAGFESLRQTPEWYRWAAGIAIGSAFGVRKFTQAVKGWKGGK